MHLKQPLTIDEQIDGLRNHNIDIVNEEYAKSILARCGYCSFTGYALEFRVKSDMSDCVAGTAFEAVADRWLFDIMSNAYGYAQVKIPWSDADSLIGPRCPLVHIRSMPTELVQFHQVHPGQRYSNWL